MNRILPDMVLAAAYGGARRIRRLFCKHDYTFLRNIYGDEIIQLGYKRSIWKCAKCGNVKLYDKLYEPAG